MADDSWELSRHLSVWIAVTAGAAYEYMADVRNLPTWAAGLAGGEPQDAGDHWVVDSPMGQVQVEFAPPNEYGVLDHVVTMPTGEAMNNPLRVLPAGAVCEVVFTVRRRPGMTDEEFEADVAAVGSDLQTLKGVLEAPRDGSPDQSSH
ncbi:MAG: SRPBCC family protein [Mycobacterium sp.]